MLFYAITYVRWPQVISFYTTAVPLDSCMVGLWHPKNKKFVFKSVNNANFWRQYNIYLYHAKISLSETPISLWEIPNLPVWL